MTRLDITALVQNPDMPIPDVETHQDLVDIHRQLLLLDHDDAPGVAKLIDMLAFSWRMYRGEDPAASESADAHEAIDNAVAHAIHSLRTDEDASKGHRERVRGWTTHLTMLRQQSRL